MRKYLCISNNCRIFASEKETNNKLNPKTRKGREIMTRIYNATSNTPKSNVYFFKNGELKKEYKIDSYSMDVWNKTTIDYLKSMGFTQFSQDTINDDYVLQAIRIDDPKGRPNEIALYKISNK